MVSDRRMTVETLGADQVDHETLPWLDTDFCATVIDSCRRSNITVEPYSSLHPRALHETVRTVSSSLAAIEVIDVSY